MGRTLGSFGTVLLWNRRVSLSQQGACWSPASESVSVSSTAFAECSPHHPGICWDWHSVGLPDVQWILFASYGLAILRRGRNSVAVTVPVVIGWGTRKRQEKWGCEFFSCWTLLRNLFFHIVKHSRTASSSARTLISLSIFVAFVYLLVCVHIHRHHNNHVEVKRSTFPESALSFHRVGLRNGTQVTSCGSKHLYLTGCLVGPRTLISVFKSATLLHTEMAVFFSTREERSKVGLKPLPPLMRMKSDVCASLGPCVCCLAQKC